jgi:hypothetical protein
VRPVPAVAQPVIAGDRPVTAGDRTVATGGSTLKARAKPAPLVLHTTSPLTYTHTETLSVSGGGTGATITYTVLSGLCTIAGNVLRAEGGTGMCKVVATMAGTDESGAVTSPVRTVVLQQAAQAAVTVTAPAELTDGTAGTAEASGGSTQGDFIFSAAGSTGCQVLGTSVTVTNPAGTCVIRAVRTGDSNYHDSAPSAPFVVKLRKAGQTVHPVPADRNQEHGPEIPTS